MDAQLLITSWAKDLAWLDYALRSVQKYWRSDFPPLLIVTSDCEGQMPRIAKKLNCNIIYEPQLDDHHRGQIHIKMNADLYAPECPLIMITDSDCLFTRPCTADDFCADGKPIIHMEAYETLIPRSIPPDQNCFACYKALIGKVLHLLAEHEYMRRHPFLFYRDHIRDVREKIESIMNQPLMDVMKGYHSGYFSEFNLWGAYCRQYHKDIYYWQDVLSAPPPIIRQFHSYSQDPNSGDIGQEVARILA